MWRNTIHSRCRHDAVAADDGGGQQPMVSAGTYTRQSEGVLLDITRPVLWLLHTPLPADERQRDR